MERILKSKYKILEKICDSPSHATYEGVMVDSGAPLVIKIFKREALNSSLVKKIKRDVSEIEKVHSDSIPKILDGDYGWQGFYFVREFVDGKSAVEIKKPLDPEAACAVVSGVCDALDFAHSKGLVHGSLTPSNVFVCGPDLIKVCDFGLRASVFGSLEQRAGQLFSGYPAFLAPETVLGEDPSASSDVFQAGLLLYLLLTGDIPFGGAPGLDCALDKIRKAPLPPSSRNNKIPRYLDEIVMKCLERDPLLRFESAEELKKSLENKAPLSKKDELPEMPQIPVVSEEDTPALAASAKQDISRSVYQHEEKDDKINMFRWVFFAIWLAIAAGIIYSLINIFIMGE